MAKVKGTRTYRFKIRARNACGVSQYSPIFKVNIAFAPAQMQKVQLEQKECTFKLKWTPPDDKGAPILRYNLEVKGASGEFYSAKICGQNPDSTSSLLFFSTMQDKPYSLKEND